MPSEQRLHPATLLFDLAGHIKRFAIPALLVIFGASRSSGGPGGTFGGVPAGWEAWLLVMFVPAMIFSVARYLSFRLHYDERELVIRTGLVFRNVRHIPFARIQNVDAVQNVFHRFFGVVEVRVETGGGKEEEARLSVLPRAAFDEMRQHVFSARSANGGGNPFLGLPAEAGAEPAPEPAGDTLVHLPLRELLLCGFLENKGMVLVGAGAGVVWQTGLGDLIMGRMFGGSEAVGRGFFRSVFRGIFDGGPLPIANIGLAIAAFGFFLIAIRVVSMAWAFVRLYDFRLTRIGEDLRTHYGLFTRVTTTVPIRRVQTLIVSAGPLHRWLDRATVRVETAGGSGQGSSSAGGREWLAPLIRVAALPGLIQQVVPGADLSALEWHPVHPRAFRRALKPNLVVAGGLTIAAAVAIGWGAIGVLLLASTWAVIGARQYVAHLGWSETDEVVVMRSGWLWKQVTLARVNKIQAVTLYQTPFDRRAAMARVRVDTAGAREMSHRIDVPYLDVAIARALHQRLSAHAAVTAFKW
ncbi:MAG: PH domain-containing protein [Acidobacteriota bacterium]|nr:PH domain-containing protein [Acidobacteriota bacterium]